MDVDRSRFGWLRERVSATASSLGAWLEQLVAESTGKRGTGIIPVDQEPLGGLTTYANDRVFVRLVRPLTLSRPPMSLL